jgi:hypothetical protein
MSASVLPWPLKPLTLSTVLALGALPSIPALAGTGGLDCDHRGCVLEVTEHLAFEASADAVFDGLNGIEMTGDVLVHTPSQTFTLTEAELIFRPRPEGGELAFELVGSAAPPLAELPLFDGAQLTAQPIAAVGLVSRATLKALLEDDEYRLPLAENPKDPYGDPAELVEPAYLFFHFATGLAMDMPLGAWLGVDAEAGEHDPFAFSVPGDKSLTFILDPMEPYFFLSQDARAMLMDAMDAAYHEADAYAQAREEQRKQEQSEAGNASAGQTDGEPADSDSSGGADGSDGRREQERPKQDGPEQVGDEESESMLPELGELAFSWLGGIPFEPVTTWGLPLDVGRFRGHVFLDATVPLYKFIELTGKVVTHTSEQGFEQGGNGEVQVAFDLIPKLLSFSFPLGDASAGVRLIEDDVVSYFSGIHSPDYSFLPPIIPVLPTNTTLVAGYISSRHPEQSRIIAAGAFGYDMSGFRAMTGLQLQDLMLSEAHLSIGAGGVSLRGRTGVSIHPSIELGAEARVEIYFSPQTPEESYLEMNGEMLVAGVGLKPVTLRLDRNGLFLEGAFVTPVSELALAGEITPRGPVLSGRAGIAFDVGDVRAAIEDARSAVVAARRRVEVLENAADTQRAIVTAEREQTVARLVEARKHLAATRDRVSSLRSSIASHERAISSYRSQIRSKYRWYKRQPWYKRAWAWGRYAAYRAGKTAQIGWRYGQIGALKGALAVATGALHAAEGAVRTIEAGIAVTPIDADPRVAGPLLALETARGALTAAEAALPRLPDIDAEIRGDINLTLTHRGLRGRLDASANGRELAEGRVKFGAKPEACIDLNGLGALCAPF